MITDVDPTPASDLYSCELTKADGRKLTLYARHPISRELNAPSPPGGASAPPNPHLRWHPFRGEWVAYAGHRQARTFLPPSEFNPLAPTTDAANPTELPAGAYDVAVFDNRFPTLFGGAHDPPAAIVPTMPARGGCEVIVFTQDPSASLGTLPLSHLELIVDVWAHRQQVLGARKDVAYVMPFENRGVEMGVSLSHPHGQIYAYPFVPPLAEASLARQRTYYDASHRGLLEDHVAAEEREGRRMLYTGDHVSAFVPVFARYAYEVWIAPRVARASLVELDTPTRRDLARALKTVLLKLDGLWAKPMPYVMAFHQAPTDGQPHPYAHLRVEIYPALRMPNRIKYLAGSELAAGVFTADTLPEDKAEELRRIEVSL